jgi:AcrR family transcriptional regulator
VSEAGSSRQERRKATTRARIAVAADELFAAQGYAATSMDDIATAADVALRTIYLHFDSKAAVLLAYFDEWVDAFTDAIIARPADEPVGASVEAALRELEAEGWAGKSIAESSGAHPILGFLGEGPPEIAGHILHRWVLAQNRIAEDAVARGGYPPGALEPRARAAAVFASWLATMLAFEDGHRGSGLPTDLSDHAAGAAIARLISGGSV